MTGKIFLITQCAVHLTCLFVSLYLIVPVITHMSDFCGHCALFSCGTYIEDDGRFEPDWAPNSNCIYSIIVGFLVFLSSLSQILLKLRILYQNRESTFLEAFCDVLVDGLTVLIVFINSILITVGFYKWCSCVMQRFSSCDVASSVMVIGLNSTIIPTNFSFQLETVQFGVWSLLVCAVFQMVLSIRKVLVYHDRENLIASMTQERLRYQNG